MDEYISKQSVIDYLNGYLDSIGECGANNLLFDRGQRRALINAIQDILAIKAADVEPVRHGRWIRSVSKGFPKNPTCLWYCSCCGEKIRYNDTLRTYQKLKKPVNEVNPRCRKCGAKMDLDYQEGEP